MQTYNYSDLAPKFFNMNWKKSTLFFIFQALNSSSSFKEFNDRWKYLKVWRSSQKNGRSSVNDEWAWINFSALEFLSKWLAPEHVVFEYGGGGSTLFFLKKVKEVITVEHDKSWFEILEKTIWEKKIKSWKGFQIEGKRKNDNVGLDPENPLTYSSRAKGFEMYTFEEYATVIHQYPDNYFDLILVDGRSRTSCINECLGHLKTGGILVIDNAEREYYTTYFDRHHAHKFQVMLRQHGPVPYTPDFTTTLILKKLTA